MSVESIQLVAEGLAGNPTLDSRDVTLLEERLPVVFEKRDLSRRTGRRGKKRTASEILANSRSKNAHLKYLDFLKWRPHVFLPIVLSVGLRTCSECNVSKTISELTLDPSYTIILHRDDRRKIENIALGRNFHNNLLFTGWMDILSGKPIISQARQTFITGNVQALGIFGDELYHRIINSPMRIEEIRTGTMEKNTTHCTQTVVPQDAFDDMVLWLNIALDEQFLQKLFPDYQSQLSMNDKGDEEVVLTTASTLNVDSILKTLLHERWNKSRLRMWEEQEKFSDVTTGIQVQVRRNDLSSGTMRLTLSWEWHQEIRTLYSSPTESPPRGSIVVP